MGNVLDLDKLRAFRYSKPKKRGRPSKKDQLYQYPDDLKITVEYFDSNGDPRQYTFHVDKGPFQLKDMDINYKKLMVEISMKISAEMCMDDPAMIYELEDWLKSCFIGVEE